MARKGKRTVGPVEKEFERFRPENKPSRLAAWFMANDPERISELGAVSRRYYYLLEPAGPVHRGDLWWIELTSFRLVEPQLAGGLRPRTLKSPGPKTPLSPAAYEKAIRAAATRYWAGRAYTDSKNARWEFHTNAARVVRLIGEAA